METTRQTTATLPAARSFLRSRNPLTDWTRWRSKSLWLSGGIHAENGQTVKELITDYLGAHMLKMVKPSKS